MYLCIYVFMYLCNMYVICTLYIVHMCAFICELCIFVCRSHYVSLSLPYLQRIRMPADEPLEFHRGPAPNSAVQSRLQHDSLDTTVHQTC